VKPQYNSSKKFLSQELDTSAPNKGITGKLPTGLKKVTQHTLHHYLKEKNMGTDCLTLVFRGRKNFWTRVTNYRCHNDPALHPSKSKWI